MVTPMKLTRLEIRKGFVGSYNSQGTYIEPEMEGFVEFEGQTGIMKLRLTKQDLRDIEQLLRIKTKVLGAEA